MKLPLIVAALASSMPLAAQPLKVTPNVTLMGGIAGGPTSGWQLRGDIHFATLGRLEPGFGLSYWSWEAGYDALPGGAPVETDAITIDAGAIVRLGRVTGWSPFLLGRFGWVDYGDQGQWDLSPGIGIRRIGKNAIGFTADVRYHSLFSGASADDASQPSDDDYWTLLAGVVIRF